MTNSMHSPEIVSKVQVIGDTNHYLCRVHIWRQQTKAMRSVTSFSLTPAESKILIRKLTKKLKEKEAN